MDLFEKIAQEHVESLGEVLPGIKYRFANRKDFFFQVYYDFVFVDLDGNPLPEPPFVGGAVGFSIDKKTHKTESCSTGDLASMEINQQEQEEVYQKITTAQDNSKSWLWLKSKYGLNSRELLAIKKIVNITNFTKHQVIEELDHLIAKNRS